MLTIAIPTYNRANKLDQQLGRIAKWQGKLASISIRVHDNASTDETQLVIEKWKLILKERLVCLKHPINLGLVGNYITCIEQCETSHVWVMGDDDPIHEAGADAVLSDVSQYPQLGLFALNFRPISGTSKKILKEAALPLDLNERFPKGSDFVEACQRYEYGCLMFITAVVLHTDAARKVLAERNIPTDNLALPFYVPAFVGSRYGARLVEEIVFDGYYGVGSWKKREFQVFYLDVPHVLEELAVKAQVGKGLIDQYLASYAIHLFKPKKRYLKTPLLWWKAVRTSRRLAQLRSKMP